MDASPQRRAGWQRTLWNGAQRHQPLGKGQSKAAGSWELQTAPSEPQGTPVHVLESLKSNILIVPNFDKDAEKLELADTADGNIITFKNSLTSYKAVQLTNPTTKYLPERSESISPFCDLYISGIVVSQHWKNPPAQQQLSRYINCGTNILRNS